MRLLAFCAQLLLAASSYSSDGDGSLGGPAHPTA
jgi:hypothetical protein